MKQLVGSQVLPAVSDRLLYEALEAERTPATRRAYGGAVRVWSEWARRGAYAVFPAAPEGLARFLVERHAQGLSVSSLRLSLAALADWHVRAGFDDPTKHPAVRAVARGLRRLPSDAARQAKALTSEVLAVLRAAPLKRRALPFGARESAAEAKARQAFDLALAHVLSDGGLRRGEAAVLAWDDVERQPDGSGRLLVRRSKTDREGVGAVVYLTPLSVRLLGRLARLNGVRPDGRVFGLTGRRLSDRIARMCEEAGLGPGYSGHSGRVGLARRMVARGAPQALVQLQGRWKDPAMVARYARNENVSSVAPWL